MGAFESAVASMHIHVLCIQANKLTEARSVAGFAATGDFESMVKYSTANGYKPDYLYLMQRMMMDNPEAAVNLAKMVAKQPGPPIDLNTMTDLFLQVKPHGHQVGISIAHRSIDVSNWSIDCSLVWHRLECCKSFQFHHQSRNVAVMHNLTCLFPI